MKKILSSLTNFLTGILADFGLNLLLFIAFSALCAVFSPILVAVFVPLLITYWVVVRVVESGCISGARRTIYVSEKYIFSLVLTVYMLPALWVPAVTIGSTFGLQNKLLDKISYIQNFNQQYLKKLNLATTLL